MSQLALRTVELDAFADRLLDGPVRIPLTDLWAHWAQAVPRLVGNPRQAAALAVALDALADRGVIELPVQAWDRSTHPPLPRSVVVPASRRAGRSRDWMRFPWQRELGWVASLPTLSTERFADLVAINDWLSRRAGRKPPVVPMRYRSVELFGDEKRLDGLLRVGQLSGAGRLTLELLSCVRLAPPLPAVSVGPGPDLLVVENSDTYWAAVSELRHASGHQIGAVAWGVGKAFPSQIGTLAVDVAGRGPVRGTSWYWGDFDPAGVRTALSAAAAAHAAREAPVRPAAGLWEAMADRPTQGAGTIDWTGVAGEDWFGAALWGQLAGIRSAGGRVAQESVSPTAIREWATRVV